VIPALASRIGGAAALDEAATPADARTIIAMVILPLTETCADAGAQVIVATRRSDAAGGLLTAFGGAVTLIDLDTPAYFAQEDLAAGGHCSLLRAPGHRAGEPPGVASS
jgi:hypothetical protein